VSVLLFAQADRSNDGAAGASEHSLHNDHVDHFSQSVVQSQVRVRDKARFIGQLMSHFLGLRIVSVSADNMWECRS